MLCPICRDVMMPYSSTKLRCISCGYISS